MQTSTLDRNNQTAAAAHGTIEAAKLRKVSNPLFERLAQAVELRNATTGDAANYSRMHHRHNRA